MRRNANSAKANRYTIAELAAQIAVLQLRLLVSFYPCAVQMLSHSERKSLGLVGSRRASRLNHTLAGQDFDIESSSGSIRK